MTMLEYGSPQFGITNMKDLAAHVTQEQAFWDYDQKGQQGCVTDIFEYPIELSDTLASRYDKWGHLQAVHKELKMRGYTPQTHIRLLTDVPQPAMDDADDWKDLLTHMVQPDSQRVDVGVYISDDIKHHEALKHIGFEYADHVQGAMLRPYKGVVLKEANMWDQLRTMLRF